MRHRFLAAAFGAAVMATAAVASGVAARAQSFLQELARPLASQRLIGSWIGEYVCAQGVTRLHLNVGESMPNYVRAVFHFYESPRNPGVPTGCFMVGGRYSQARRDIDLKPERWLLRPPNYDMVGVRGRFSADGLNFTGTISGAPGCTRVTLMTWSDPPKAPPECQHDEP
jgi:hypothetical protein